MYATGGWAYAELEHFNDSGAGETFSKTQNGWTVSGTRSDGNDATYYPTRGLDTHLDFTNAAAYAWWRDGLRRLIARGVDGEVVVAQHAGEPVGEGVVVFDQQQFHDGKGVVPTTRVQGMANPGQHDATASVPVQPAQANSG